MYEEVEGLSICDNPKHRKPRYPYELTHCDDVCGEEDYCDDWTPCIYGRLDWTGIQRILAIAKKIDADPCSREDCEKIINCYNES